MDDTAVVVAVAAVAVVIIITNFLNKARRADEPLCPHTKVQLFLVISVSEELETFITSSAIMPSVPLNPSSLCVMCCVLCLLFCTLCSFVALESSLLSLFYCILLMLLRNFYLCSVSYLSNYLK